MRLAPHQQARRRQRERILERAEIELVAQCAVGDLRAQRHEEPPRVLVGGKPARAGRRGLVKKKAIHVKA